MAAALLRKASSGERDGVAVADLSLHARGTDFGGAVDVAEAAPGGVPFIAGQALGASIAVLIAVGSIVWFIGVIAEGLVERGATGKPTRWIASNAAIASVGWGGILVFAALALVSLSDHMASGMPSFR